MVIPVGDGGSLFGQPAQLATQVSVGPSLTELTFSDACGRVRMTSTEKANGSWFAVVLGPGGRVAGTVAEDVGGPQTAAVVDPATGVLLAAIRREKGVVVAIVRGKDGVERSFAIPLE